MKRGWIAIAVLSLFVGGAGLWIAYRPAPADDLKSLSPTDAASVKRIVITPRDQPPIVIERTDDDWHMTAPMKAGVDEFRVRQLLGVLAARPTARIASPNLTELDLDRPILTLQFGSETLRFGGLNALTSEQSVATASGVYAAEARIGSGIPVQAQAYLRKTLLASSEKPVGFRLSSFSVKKADGRWTVDPVQSSAGADDVTAWVDAWRTASALRVDKGVEAPAAARVEISMESGNTVTLDIVRREPDLVLRRRDDGLEYRLFAGLARRLLEPPGTATPEKK